MRLELSHRWTELDPRVSWQGRRGVSVVNDRRDLVVNSYNTMKPLPIDKLLYRLLLLSTA